MRNFFKRYLPSSDVVKKHRWLHPFGDWLGHPNLWHLNRRSVAGGVAIGLFCGLIPGPLQMIGASLLAILLRANLPVALATTLYTNPFTIVPLYLLAYELGAWITGMSSAVPKVPFPELHWQNMLQELWDWMMMLGKPLLIGLPVLALLLAIIGYVLIRGAWRVSIVFRWRARQNKHRVR